MRLFRQLGLAPLAYANEAPANTAANSYYFTISPPARTTVTALISNVEGSHADDGELDCSSTSFHLHNETESAYSQSALLRSYVLPERREHTLIAAGALLNIWLVYLVSQGRFVNDFGAQTLILLTPTVLTGIIARQQDHYYAPATGYQRALLWLYLFGGAAFVVTVAFSRQGLPGGAAGWGPSAKEILIGFAALSAFIAGIYGLGPSFHWITRWRVRRLALKEARKEEREQAKATNRKPRAIDKGSIRYWIGPNAVRRYQKAVLQFCTGTLIVAIVAAGLVCAKGVCMWHKHEFMIAPAAAASAPHSTTERANARLTLSSFAPSFR